VDRTSFTWDGVNSKGQPKTMGVRTQEEREWWYFNFPYGRGFLGSCRFQPGVNKGSKGAQKKLNRFGATPCKQWKQGRRKGRWGGESDGENLATNWTMETKNAAFAKRARTFLGEGAPDIPR